MAKKPPKDESITLTPEQFDRLDELVRNPPTPTEEQIERFRRAEKAWPNRRASRVPDAKVLESVGPLDITEEDGAYVIRTLGAEVSRHPTLAAARAQARWLARTRR